MKLQGRDRAGDSKTSLVTKNENRRKFRSVIGRGNDQCTRSIIFVSTVRTISPE